MYCCSRCHTDVHVLQEGISYSIICNLLYRGTHVIWDRFNWRVCPIGSLVLHESMSYRWTCLAVVLHVI